MSPSELRVLAAEEKAACLMAETASLVLPQSPGPAATLCGSQGVQSRYPGHICIQPAAVTHDQQPYPMTSSCSVLLLWLAAERLVLPDGQRLQVRALKLPSSPLKEELEVRVFLCCFLCFFSAE